MPTRREPEALSPFHDEDDLAEGGSRRERRGRHGRRSPAWVAAVASALLVAIPALALLWNGASGHLAQAALHLLVGAALVVVSRYAASHLEKAGRVLRLLLALAALPAAVAVGLVPLPSAVLRWVAPGTAAAFPGFAFHPASIDPEGTVTALAQWALALGWVAVVGVWASSGRRVPTAERAVVFGMAGLLLFALAHALLGAKSILGIVPVNDPPERFFAPFVNANFLGTLIVLTLPVMVRAALDAVQKDPLWGWLVWVPPALAVFTAAWIHSPGTLLALIVQIAVFAAVLVRLGRASWAWVGAGGAVAVAGFVAMVRDDPHWARESLHPRVAQWADLPAMLGDFWLTGAGVGAFELAYAPYRTIPEFARYPHAHNDPLEWLVSTGLIGVVALGWAAWWLPRAAHGERRAMWSLGLMGALVSACWNFPLQIPGVLLVVLAVLTVRLTAYEHTLSPPTRVARVLFALAALQLPAALWHQRAATADAASAILENERSGPLEREEAAAALASSAPWRAQTDLHEAWQARRDRDPRAAAEAARAVAAANPHDARTLRRAALVLQSVGAADEALPLLDRALVRDPNDYRTWAARSRLYRQRTEGGRALEDWVAALHHWPAHATEGAKPLDEGWELAPVGEYWLDALADAPGHWSSLLALRLLHDKQPELAMVALRQARRLDPVRQRESTLWVDVLVAQGRAAEGEALARDLVRRDRLAWRNWLALGQAIAAQGRHDEAIATYLDGLRLPDHRSELGTAAIYAGQQAGGPDRALQIATQVQVHLPSDPYVALAVARMHHAKGDLHLCRARLDQGGLRVHPATRTHAEPLWQACNSNAQPRP